MTAMSEEKTHKNEEEEGCEAWREEGDHRLQRQSQRGHAEVDIDEGQEKAPGFSEPDNEIGTRR